MPLVDGSELCRRVRKQMDGATRHAAVIGRDRPALPWTSRTSAGLRPSFLARVLQCRHSGAEGDGAHPCQDAASVSVTVTA
jgi:hypothetical protein